MSSASFQCIEDPFHVLPTKPNKSCPRPSKCDPCGGSCMPICGTLNPNLTCRPGGRAWGRACGPVCLENNQWKQPTLKLKNCKPIKIRGRKSCSLPYGFGLYARKLYPYGIPCKGTFCLPMPSCDQCFYPSLPTKPAKVYSTYTFNVRGPPYTCPRPCISC